VGRLVSLCPVEKLNERMFLTPLIFMLWQVDAIVVGIRPLELDAHERHPFLVELTDVNVDVNVPETRIEIYLELDRAARMPDSHLVLESNWLSILPEHIRHFHGGAPAGTVLPSIRDVGNEHEGITGFAVADFKSATTLAFVEEAKRQGPVFTSPRFHRVPLPHALVQREIKRHQLFMKVK
jgi:hypothetical protein